MTICVIGATGRVGRQLVRRGADVDVHQLQGDRNLRAVQILLGHTKIENTVRYRGVNVEDALTLAEGTEIRLPRFLAAGEGAGRLRPRHDRARGLHGSLAEANRFRCASPSSNPRLPATSVPSCGSAPVWGQ